MKIWGWSDAPRTTRNASCSRIVSVSLIVALGLVMVGCSASANDPMSNPSGEASVQSADSKPVEDLVPERPPRGVNLQALWVRQLELDGQCRGNPQGIDERSCAARDSALREHFFLSADELYDAWISKDAARMRALSHPSNRAWPGRLIPEDLLKHEPAEPKFDCRYDVVSTGEVGCYIKFKDMGNSFYFKWEDDVERGWLVTGFVPDV